MRQTGTTVWRQIISRLLWSVPTLVFITLLTFVIGELAPGDAATVIAGEKGSPELKARIREEMGLNDPIAIRYMRFVGNACRLQFGTSLFPPYGEVRDVAVDGMGFRELGILILIVSVAACSVVSLWKFLYGMIFYSARKAHPPRLVRVVITAVTGVLIWYLVSRELIWYLWQFIRPDFLGRTGPLAFLAICLASLSGVLLGSIAGIWHSKWPDRIASTLSTLGVCIPTFVLAPAFVIVFALKLQLLPDTWVLRPEESILYYLIPPVVILAMRPAAVITRLTRASMIDTLGQDFIRTAFAKGVPFWRVMTTHAFRNSLVTVVTAIGTSFGFLLTGSFILETYFRIPGLGLKSIDAIYQGDFPVIQATVLLFAVLFIFVNLLVDILLPLLDPRIRSGSA